MKKQALVVTAIALLGGALTTNGFGQAAAEYSAATAGSASATANAGSSLGSSVNSSLNKTTQRFVTSVPERTPAPVERQRVAVRRARRAVIGGPLPVNPQAASTRQIRMGSGRTDAQPAREAATGSKPCAPSAATGSPDRKTNPPCKPEPQTEYPSHVTLSFPQ